MAKYILTEIATEDLEGIYEFTERENPAAAERLLGTLFSSFESLAEMPGIGHTRTDLTPHDVLFWPVSRYLVIYQKNVDNIAIVRVLGATMDISAIL